METVMRRSFALIALLGGLTLATASRAAVVDLNYQLDLNGMSSGTCPSGVCGTVSIKGDTTSSLTYTIDLATGVSFHANHPHSSGTGPFLYFQLTDANPIKFSDLSLGGTISGKTYSYNDPTTKGGPFDPSSGNFPGTYDFEATCTNSTAGKICGSTFTFTASGATTADPFVIGAPAGHGLFAGDDIALVADLSLKCGDKRCTGLVGSEPILGGPGLTTGVPEPSTWAMMIVGFMGLGFLAYRKKNSIPRFA
jgi:hypothetical protein